MLAKSFLRHPLGWSIGASCGLFVLIALQFLWVTPLLETPDSIWHYRYIHILARTGHFPTLPSSDPMYSANQEAAQFPLYYLIGAALVRPIDDSDLDQIVIPDPHGVAQTGLTKTLAFHRPPSLTPGGAELAIRVVELFSIACGAITVSCAVLLARLYRPEQPGVWLGAGVAAGVVPAFDAVSAGVSNDNLVVALCSFTLLVLALWLEDGRQGWGWLAAVALALAVLAKFNAIGLAACFVLALAWRQRQEGGWLRGLAKLALAGLAIDGWWLVRNVWLYGEPSGMLALQRQSFGAGYEPFKVTSGAFLADMLAEVPNTFHTFFVAFGHYNIDAPWAFALFAILATPGLVAGLGRAARDWRRPLIQLLLLWPTLVGLEILGHVVLSSGSGRYLYPALAALALLAADGWGRIVAAIRWRPLGYSLAAACTLAASACAWLAVEPAYAYPPELAALPASATPLHATFAGSVELLGAELAPDRTLTLYWRRTGPLDLPLSEFIHVDAADAAYKPGFDYEGATGGNFPPNFWPLGAVIVDKHAVTLAPDGRLDRRNAVLLTIKTGMYYQSSHAGAQPERVSADPPAAADTGIEVGRIKLAGEPPPAPAQPLAQFANGLDLLEAHATADGAVDLRWQARSMPTADASVFVQALDTVGNVLAQHDSYPLDGRYPTTLWSAGEQVFDRVSLALPRPLTPDDRVIVGMYVLPDAGARTATLDGGSFVIVPR